MSITTIMPNEDEKPTEEIKKTSNEVFSGEFKEEISAEDIFADKGSLLENLGINDRKSQSSRNSASQSSGPPVPETLASAKSLNKMVLIMIANAVVLSIVAAVLVHAIMQRQKTTVVTSTPDTKQDTQALDTKELKINEEKLKEYKEGVSYALAQSLFNQGKYQEALNVFLKLNSKITQHDLSNEVLKDYIDFNIALCLEQLGKSEKLGNIFTKLLTSKSPAIELLTNYHLIFIEMANHNYLEARKRAYRSLALLSPYKSYFSEDMEQNIYFVIAESLTNHVLEMSDPHYELPGRLWTKNMRIESVPVMEQEKLSKFLLIGKDSLNKALFGPNIKSKTMPDGKVIFDITSNNAPLNESLGIIANSANINLDWGNCSQDVRVEPVTMIYDGIRDFYACEIFCGYNGLIPIFSENNISIYNPSLYTDLSFHKNILITQAISVWRRYLVRYREHKRMANVHFAMAKLYELSGNLPTALAEYKLIFNRFPHHDTASYAIYESSKIKAKLGDFAGVKNDLNELITLHPDSKILDLATLSLAQTSYISENYNEAAMLFSKAFSFDTNRETKSKAAIGAGKSFFKLKSYEQAKNCINRGIALYEKQDKTDICEAYEILGKSYENTNDLENAAKSFAKAMAQRGISYRRKAKIAIEKALVELKRNEEARAIQTLETINTEQLSQETTTQLLITKSRAYRQIGLYETAITILRNKIEYMPKKELRAKLAIELATSYHENNQNEFARRELVRAIRLLPIGKEMCLANITLAQVSMELGNYDDAIDACQRVLSIKENQDYVDQANSIIAKAYNKKGLYKEAADTLKGIVTKK